VTIGYEDFAKVDVRVGTVRSAAPNPAARKPAYVLEIDFGPELGRKKASAQLTDLYAPEQLLGRQVAAVVNFPPKQIARTLSEVLVLGFPDAEGRVVLINVDHPVPNGARMF
jgi:tRNA-binding protein